MPKRTDSVPRGLRTPRERVWAALLKVGAPRGQRFTAYDVQDACSPMVLMPTVQHNLRAFARAGYLEETAPSAVHAQHGARHSTVVYRLVQAGVDAPRVDGSGKPTTLGLGVLSMWRAMRIHKAFDFRDIARAATLPPVVVSEETARKYVDALYRAGYLQQLRAPTRQAAGQYRLLRDTGPHAPAITRRRCVLDRNTGAFVDLESAQEVCDGLE
jgi:hypothetical protein